MGFDIGLDLFPLLAATLAAVTCGLLGNFLVLRRLSLMGDAISHSVLPGLVIAFLVASTRSPLVMFAGAAVAGVATVILVELVKKLGRVEPGAAMGVVFSVLFALGVLLLEEAAADAVDLDAECVLHGQLETLAWYGAPAEWSGLWSADTIEAAPRQVTTLAAACALAALFVTLLFKELRIAAFDPALATTQGYHAGFLHYLLMIFVAGATVASFEAVGSILVIAMLICPAATARLLTDRLRTQIALSAVLAAAAGVLGYAAATLVPGFFGKDSVNAAGMMAVVAGALLVVAAVAAPGRGVIATALRRRGIARSIERDDALARLYRAGEAGEAAVPIPGRARKTLERCGLVEPAAGGVRLTPEGERAAADLVRRHRLWETYLVERAGLAADHVHSVAERLEHLEAVRPEGGDRTDPHGRPIPSKPPREE